MRLCLFLFALALLLPLSSTSTIAHPAAENAVELQASADALVVRWQAAPFASSQLPAPAEAVALRMADAELPARLIPLQVQGETPLQLQFDRVESRPWHAALPAATPLLPPPGSVAAERAAPADLAVPALPTAPLTVLREASIRGTRIAVVALTPLFLHRGAPHVASFVEASIPNVVPLQTSAAALLNTSGPFLSNVAPPWQPAGPAVKLLVEHAGLQRLTGADLAAAGFDLSAVDPARLWLRRAGQPLPLDISGSGAGLELRFYAAAPRDRWNAADVYWLSIEPDAGPRMSSRQLRFGTAPARRTALERGVWRNNTLYDSTLPGPDEDHWYAADLRTGPEQPPASLAFRLEPQLPAAPGATQLTVEGVAYTTGEHRLQVQLGAESQEIVWSGAGNWSHTVSLASNELAGALHLMPSTVADGVEIDAIYWTRPATLDMAGNGAMFDGVDDEWRYQLNNVPPDAVLYDISDPAAPQRLSALAEFQDGPTPRRYLLAGPGTVHRPRIATYAAADFGPQALDVVYIAVAELHGALEPLLDLRRSQGYRVARFDAAAIYDAWSAGYVDPEAIRSFLRYTASWPEPPHTVVLVGDGTSDPLDYTGRANPNLLPPYLARIDPWIGETACENCFVQLDGNDPLNDVLPDMAIGRLAVASVADLQRLVTKILRYETAAPGGSWRTRAVYLADNADVAGDFAAMSNQAIQHLPPPVDARRVYYDPQPAEQPWYVSDPLAARERALAYFSAGAALLTYTGHSNQWQWAVTAPPLQAGQPTDKQFLFGLFDVDILNNGERLPVVLAMTCLSSAFQTPAFSGTSVDERLVLRPDGGAIATWGSTGQGVANGHDALQRGFLQALSASTAPPRLSDLTAAGYLELFARGGCCQDALRTFAVLGDPLTNLQIDTGPARIYLPVIANHVTE